MQQLEIPQQTKQTSSAGRAVLKVLLQVLLLGGCIGIVYLPPVREQLGRVQEISTCLQGLGWRAPLVFVPAVAVLVAVGVPRLLLCPIGGLAFGFWWGLALTQLGTVLGFYATFLFVRVNGRDFILRKWPRLKRYTEFSRRRGIITVLLIRQLPVTGFYINLLLGLLPLSHADFILGTIIGILPEAVPATLVGAGVLHFSSGQSLLYTLLACAVLVLVWLFAGRMLRSFFLKDRLEAAEEKVFEDAAGQFLADINKS